MINTVIDNSSYICNTPVVFIIFNRPEEAKQTFLAIKKVAPTKLIFISDGARFGVANEQTLVEDCRELSNQVDWDCEVIRIFSNENLGCMRRIVSGLSEVFSFEARAIIIEDDCMPTIDFFKFTEWGLNYYEKDLKVGMISGSNLICHKYQIDFRNGFSNYINIWGWATWSRVWQVHNPYLTLKEVKLNFKKNIAHLSFNWWERLYWKQLFRFTIYSGSTWDFQLQYTFFKQKMTAVYPSKNTVFNIGFSGNGTHTNLGIPEYVRLTKPDSNFDVFNSKIDSTTKVSIYRDKLIANEIWNMNILTALRLKLMNLFRLNF